jgi:hypothetical protein
LAAGVVCYKTADRLGLNPVAASIAFIVSSTLATWSTQAIRYRCNFDEKGINEATKNERVTIFYVLKAISHPLSIKIAQTATEKLGVPLSFVQCAGILGFYSPAVEFPLQRIISHLNII